GSRTRKLRPWRTCRLAPSCLGSRARAANCSSKWRATSTRISKMNCNETRPLLEAYLDDELDLVHSLAIEQHVESCTDCRRRRDELKSLRKLLRENLPRPAAPAQMRERVR